jgi:phosphate-selective porin
VISRAVFCVVAVALLAGLAGQAVAGEDTESRIRVLEQEVQQLRTALAQQQAKQESIDNEIEDYFAKAGDGADVQGNWNTGLGFASADKAFKVKVGGRIMVDYMFQDPNSKWEDRWGTSYNNIFELRRVRMYMSGDIYKNTFYKLSVDFAGNSVTIKDAYIGLQNVPVIGHLRVGNQKAPMSLERLSSSKYLMFMERAMAIVAFIPDRNVGIAAYNTELDGALWWGFGVFNNGTTFGKTGNNIPARLVYAPIMEENSYLHVGVNYAFIDNKSYSIGVRPENHQTNAMFVSGSFSAAENHSSASRWRALSARSPSPASGTGACSTRPPRVGSATT